MEERKGMRVMITKGEYEDDGERENMKMVDES